MRTRVGESHYLLNAGTVNKSVFGLTLQKHDTAEELWLQDAISCLQSTASGRTGDIQSQIKEAELQKSEN